MLLGRFLVFFFYRWETCVREATVLGFVGVGSLGLFIQDARARDLYDEMMVLVLAGAGLVLHWGSSSLSSSGPVWEGEAGAAAER